jgi:transposase
VLTKLFFPEQSGVRVERVYREGASVHLSAVATRHSAKCPVYHRRSWRVHSRYERTVADLPCAGDVVTIHLITRRFICKVRWCHRRIFAERLALVAPFARKTRRLWTQLQRHGFALGGDPGSRHALASGMPVSPRTLLRLVRAAPLPQVDPVVALGIDDWSQRKGHVFGTILVDLEAHRIIDLLPDRTADGVAAWLAQQSTVSFVTRDRAGAYAEAVRRAAPLAVQIADRFHVLKNLTDVVERVFSRHLPVLHAAAGSVLEQQAALYEQATSDHVALRSALNGLVSEPPFPLVADARLSAALHERRKGRDEQVLALHEEGATLASIAHRLHLTRATVRRIVRAGVDQVGARAKRPSSISPHEHYLWTRWTDGCHNAFVLWQEIQARGYTGSYVHLRRALRGWRTEAGESERQHRTPTTASTPTLKMFTPRQAAWMVLRANSALQPDERLFFHQLKDEWPMLEAVQRLALQFGQLVRRRDHEALDEWLISAEQSGIAEFHGFANGLRRDLAAVTAALKWSWSNGQTEGHVNRLKTLKRAMYGRAKLDLLRLRLLYAA